MFVVFFWWLFFVLFLFLTFREHDAVSKSAPVFWRMLF